MVRNSKGCQCIYLGLNNSDFWFFFENENLYWIDISLPRDGNGMVHLYSTVTWYCAGTEDYYRIWKLKEQNITSEQKKMYLTIMEGNF